jgi:chemotaxis protein MotB
MAKKKRQSKPDEPGVPEWVVTFGDMMSLLLCFFILLQMFSELKQEREYQRVITAIKEAFGYSGGVGVLPIDDPPLRSVVEQLESIAKRNDMDQTNISQNETPGLDGPDLRVTKVREGIMFTLGGRNTFEPYSAEVKPGVREELAKLAVLLSGRMNKVVVRGHASSKRLPPGSPWRDLDELSFARARAIKDILAELGLDEVVFRLEAVGDREPVQPRAADPEDAAENRRVEIIQTEQLIEDLNRDWLNTDPDLARGGA